MIYLTLIPIFAILDRWCGGGVGWKYTFIGRPIYYVAALIPAAFLWDWRLGVILTGWVIWREPKWKLFGGSLAPTGRKEILGTFYRHLLILPVALAALKSPTVIQILIAVLLILWTMIATQLAMTNREYANEGSDINNVVELTRGAAFGWAAYGILLFTGA